MGLERNSNLLVKSCHYWLQEMFNWIKTLKQITKKIPTIGAQIIKLPEELKTIQDTLNNRIVKIYLGKLQ